MLGLERVLSEKPPHLASGTELRRHQVDALAGMLTELIAANQRAAEPENGNGNGGTRRSPRRCSRRTPSSRTRSSSPPRRRRSTSCRSRSTRPRIPAPCAATASAIPTASGKTIAAAGFVEAARTLGVLILTHRRLLVTQFTRELTDHGYGDRLTPEILEGQTPPRRQPDHDPDLRLVRAPRRRARPRGVPARDRDEAHTALGEKTSAAIRSFPEPIYIGMTATEQLIAKQVSDVFPASVDDLPLADAARRGLIAPLRSPARAAGRGDQQRPDRRRRLRPGGAGRRRSTTRR